MADELISVIVPVYNVAPYLNRCVKSIVDQTYKNLEIISGGRQTALKIGQETGGR